MKKIWQKLKKSVRFTRKEKAPETFDPTSSELTTSPLSLQDMPDEIILKIVNFLSIKDLGRCARVSSRLKSICYDEFLWQKINVYYKKIPSDFIAHVLVNGCKYLSLQRALVKGDFKMTNIDSKLAYLDLKGFTAYDEVVFLEELLISCCELQKISLTFKTLNPKIVNAIAQNGQSLQVLDLSSCKGLNFESILYIVTECSELIELNLQNTRLCQNSIDILCAKLATKIEKLNLNELWNVWDHHIELLVKRCNNLSELELRYTHISDKSLNAIIEHASDNLEKLGIDTYVNLKLHHLYELKSMAKLKVLYFHIENYLVLSRVEKENLNRSLPHLKINQEPLLIAGSNRYYGPGDGLWEIEAKQITHFQNRRF